MAGLLDRFMRGVNAFQKDEERDPFGAAQEYGPAYSTRQDRAPARYVNERTIVTAIYNRIAIDVSSIVMKHVKQDEQKRYLADIDSGLNNCLTIEANKDQAARAFRQDMAMSLCDEGVIAIVPVDTSVDPGITTSFDILTVRVGRVVQWYPDHVKVDLYNDRQGRRQEIIVAKTRVAIVENPLYAIMNEPNSTLQRLIRKLALLDAVDEQSASGKLDIIIQLPYSIKSDARRDQANKRRDDLEMQLKGSKYGIAYADSTEKITQLNRPAENNLMSQVEFLTTMLYGQLGLTPEVMNGTADEKVMLNYWNRTIEPICDALVESMKRTFLTKTARTQGQSVEYFRDLFRLVPMSDMADIGDKFVRNEILTANELRQFIGVAPSSSPKADQLVNPNMPVSDTGVAVPGDPTATTDAAPADTTDGETPDDGSDDPEAIMNGAFDQMDAMLDDVFAGLPGDDGEDNGDA